MKRHSLKKESTIGRKSFQVAHEIKLKDFNIITCPAEVESDLLV